MTSTVQLNSGVAIEINRKLVTHCNEIFHVNTELLEGALSRVSNAMYYRGLSDVFEIAALIALSVSKSHAFANANKRTGLMLALQYLESQHIKIVSESYKATLAYAMRDLVVGEISTDIFAQILFEMSQC